MQSAEITMSAPFAASLERSLQRAASIARDQSREHVTPEDLLIALIDDEDAAPLWSALLIDVDSLRRDVAAYMQGATDGDSDDPSQASKFSPDLDRVVEIASTQVRSAGRHVVTGVDILVGLFTEPAGHFLQRQGVTRRDALLYLSHGIARNATSTGTGAAGGRPASEDIAPENAGNIDRREVMLLNDPYTPMEFVVFVLQEVFQFDRERAIRMMLSIHQNGQGSLGAYEQAKAMELAQRVEDLAIAHQHPLRCVPLPASG